MDIENLNLQENGEGGILSRIKKVLVSLPLIKALNEKNSEKKEKEKWKKIRNGEITELSDEEKLIKPAVEWWSPRNDSTYGIASTGDSMSDAIRMLVRSNKKGPTETQIKNFEIELAYRVSKELEHVYKESNGKNFYCRIETDWFPVGILGYVAEKTGIPRLSFPEKYQMIIDLTRKEVTYRYKFGGDFETLTKL